MVVFVTAVRHPETTSKMSRVYELLTLTGRSLLAQTDSRWKWIVACNEPPRLAFNDRRIFTELLEFPPVFGKTNSDQSSPLNFKTDKGTKLMSAWLRSKCFAPNYVVILDGDDWIHRDFVGFLNESPKSPVWNIGDGYLTDLANGKWKMIAGMVRYCGSGFAFSDQYLEDAAGRKFSGLERLSQDEMLSITTPGFVSDFLGDHHLPYRHAMAKHESLREIPFPSLCWVINNGMNFSQPKGLKGGRSIDQDFLAHFGLQGFVTESGNNCISDFLSERASYLKSSLVWKSTKHKGQWSF